MKKRTIAILQTIVEEANFCGHDRLAVPIDVLRDAIKQLTAQQKPVTLIPPIYEKSSDFTERHAGWNDCVNFIRSQAAGCIVQTGDADKEDDHQSSAPAVLHDVLTAVSIGGSQTELIDALTAIKPKFGAPGSRDVNVRAAHLAIDKAIEKLSNL